MNRRPPSARNALDKLLDSARKDKWAYAEAELANGAKLTIGCIFNYTVRFSTISGESDIFDLKYDDAFVLLNTKDRDALAKAIANLRAGKPAEEEQEPAPKPSKAARDQAALYDPGVGPHGEKY